MLTNAQKLDAKNTGKLRGLTMSLGQANRELVAAEKSGDAMEIETCVIAMAWVQWVALHPTN